MLLEILIAILLGFLAGIITGLLPGIHINFVATLLFINSSLLLSFVEPVTLAIFIVSMTVIHTFIDFLPSIFLGAPDEDTALSTLPGHRMLLRGRGYEAIKLTAIGCFLGIIVACILALFFIKTAPLFYPYLAKAMAFILIALSLFIILINKNKFLAFFIFILSGILGYVTLNFTLIKQPLFPLFTGLFGSSLLTLSFIQNVKLPKQKISKTKIDKKEILKALGLSIFSSGLVSFLPGVGASQAATIASGFKTFVNKIFAIRSKNPSFSSQINEKTFLIILGAINSITVLLSFVALYAIKKPRSGVAVFVGKFLPEFSLSQLWLFLVIALIVGIFSFFVTLFFAKNFSKLVSKINYKKLCLIVLIFLVVLTPFISGWFSLIILISGTSLGIFCSLTGTKKIFLMGSLLLPVILWYLI